MTQEHIFQEVDIECPLCKERIKSIQKLDTESINTIKTLFFESTFLAFSHDLRNRIESALILMELAKRELIRRRDNDQESSERTIEIIERSSRAIRQIRELYGKIILPYIPERDPNIPAPLNQAEVIHDQLKELFNFGDSFALDTQELKKGNIYIDDLRIYRDLTTMIFQIILIAIRQSRYPHVPIVYRVSDTNITGEATLPQDSELNELNHLWNLVCLFAALCNGSSPK